MSKNTEASNNASFIRGGSFLTSSTDSQGVFTPEDFSSDQLMYAKTAKDFMTNEVIPLSEKLEGKDLDLLVDLMKKAGELGLMMADIPEEYGGLSLDKASCALIMENLAGQGSFQATILVQTGIGCLPIVYYGTEEQKEKYLPGLADGSLLGCYALTEPAAGSDAMASRTKAVLSEDGTHYILNGTKQFITNARISDVLTIFGKVDGEHFTGFLIDKDTEGVSYGPDEHKMGLHGSTTCSINLEDVKVPVENVLGEVGQGHKIAFNILNIGRFKLGAVAIGVCKHALETALTYSLERKQFGRRIADFGAIREKLADMFVRTFATEATVYRTVGMIDDLLGSGEGGYGEAALQSIEEYSVECAMVKVFGTETIDFVLDEAIQSLGGYGYCAEYPLEASYRDNRVNRIYEGTNEINRIIVPTMLGRKDGAGILEISQAFKELQEELATGDVASNGEGPLAAQQDIVQSLKKVAVLVLGTAMEKYGKALSTHQPLQLRIADLCIGAFTAESTLLRAEKDLFKRGEDGAAYSIAAAKVWCEKAAAQAEALAREALITMDERNAIKGLSTLLARESVDTITLNERIAAKLIEMERLAI